MPNRASSRLTHEYLRNHPNDAARVLERLHAEAVAALLEDVPARLGAPVLGAMLPYFAGRCLLHLQPPAAGALLMQLSAPRAGAILRPLDDTRTEAIYSHLSAAHALRIRRLRRYPEDTVGAWTDAEVEVLTGRHRNAEAREQLQRNPERPVHLIYVIDELRRLQGTVNISTLLHAEPDRPLASLMQPLGKPLSARMSLDAARRHRGWASACELPVVEANGEFVGELRLGALQFAQNRGRTDHENTWLTALEVLTDGYCATASGVMRGLFAWWNSADFRDRP